MNIVTVELLDGGMVRRRFETDIDSLQHLQRRASGLSRLPAAMKVAALHLGSGLDDAQGVVLRQNALFNQVMDQTLEQQVSDGLAVICTCLVSGLRIRPVRAVS